MLDEALTALQVLNAGKKLLGGVQQAQAQGVDPLSYLLHDGWEQAAVTADLVRPGAGRLAQGIRSQLDEFRGQGRTIEGEYRVLDDGPSNEPWAGMVRSLSRRTWGGHIILGQPGSGKTTLARSLAERWAASTGYRIEAINMYGEDLPAGAVTVGMETLQARMARLEECLAALHVDDDAPDDEHLDAGDDLAAFTASVGGRIIVIDEASLGLGNTAANPARRAALQALAQCRHLDWLILYIGQWAGQIPLPLFGLTTLLVKQPTGDEEDTDRNNPVVRRLWREATEGFADVRHSPWWRYWPDPRAWTYVRMPAGAGGARSHLGMVPSGPPRQAAPGGR